MSHKKLNVKEIEEALADMDGSLRDINMQLDFEELQKFMEWYLSTYKVQSSNDMLSGCDVNLKNIMKTFGTKYFRANDQVSLMIGGKAADQSVLVPHLNCGIFTEIENLYHVELDFEPAEYSFDQFSDFLKEILDTTKNREFYVKYENVSWEYGQTKCVGVIFSHQDINL